MIEKDEPHKIPNWMVDTMMSSPEGLKPKIPFRLLLDHSFPNSKNVLIWSRERKTIHHSQMYANLVEEVDIAIMQIFRFNKRAKCHYNLLLTFKQTIYLSDAIDSLSYLP